MVAWGPNSSTDVFYLSCIVLKIVLYLLPTYTNQGTSHRTLDF